MQRVYHTKREVSLRVDCTFFEGSGWVPDKPFYVGKFTPGNGWACKARGEIFIHFEVDELRTKCILSTLVKHNLQLVDDDGTDDSDASESSVYRCRHVSTPLARVFVDSSDEDVPVRSLYPPRCDVDSPPEEVQLEPGRVAATTSWRWSSWSKARRKTVPWRLRRSPSRSGSQNVRPHERLHQRYSTRTQRCASPSPNPSCITSCITQPYSSVPNTHHQRYQHPG